MVNIRHKFAAALLAALLAASAQGPAAVWANSDPGEDNRSGNEISGEEDLENLKEEAPQAPVLTGSFDNFVFKNEFSDATFSDVAEGDWFYKSVKESYVLGLISGRPENRFDPQDSVSLAEAISMAARLHSVYYDIPLEESAGGPWYDSAVKYALEHGIIESNAFSSYEKSATRAELAHIFYRTFAQADLRVINSVTTLPDVTENTPYYEDIYKLYNAGILSGSDQYGTFSPSNNITRGETSVLLTRLAVPARRQTLNLIEFEGSLWSAPIASADGLFTLSVPINWSKSSSPSSSASVLEIETYPAERKISAFTTAKSSLPDGHSTNFANHHNQVVQDLSVTLKSGQIHSTDSLSVDGKEGLLSHVTGKDNNILFYYWVLTIDQGDSFVLLTGCTSKSDAASAGDDILSILTSCQFDSSRQEAPPW